MGRALHAQGTRDPVFTPGAPGAVGRALNVQGTRDPVFTLGAPGAVGRALHAQGTRDPVFTPGAPGAVGWPCERWAWSRGLGVQVAPGPPAQLSFVRFEKIQVPFFTFWPLAVDAGQWMFSGIENRHPSRT